MDQKMIETLCAVYEQAQQDGEYRKLLEECREREPQLLEQLEVMNASQRDAVLDYLGLTEEMHRKLLELACKL
jgi:DNA-binding transcriptional regulator YbjK